MNTAVIVFFVCAVIGIPLGAYCLPALVRANRRVNAGVAYLQSLPPRDSTE